MFKNLFCIFVVLIFSVSAWTLDLKEARALKVVKELDTGFIKINESKVTKDNKAAVEKLVKEVNAKRKSHYMKIAAKNKLSIDEVAKKAAKKIQSKLKK